MKRTFTRLAALATVAAAALTLTPSARAQGNNPQPRPQRIVIVNIAKVLRDYNKANFQGAEITKKREVYVKQVEAIQLQITEINKQIQQTPVPEQKKALEEKVLGHHRRMQDIDREAKRELTQLSNDTIVRVYQEIKQVIYDIAKTNNLDMVLCYPAATKPEDENSPQVAQLMLQTPALIPFYHSGMDITHVVVETLNKRHPAPVNTAGNTTPAPMGGAPTAPLPGGGR